MATIPAWAQNEGVQLLIVMLIVVSPLIIFTVLVGLINWICFGLIHPSEEDREALRQSASDR